MSEGHGNKCVELWLDIPGYKGRYQLSTHDRVRSVSRNQWNGKVWHKHRAKIKKLTPTKAGYLLVTLWKNNKGTTFGLHQLKLMVLVGPCPEGMEACHNDGNVSNNDLDNLRWGTTQSNIMDNHLHGKRDYSQTYSLGPNATDLVCSVYKTRLFGRKELADILNVSLGVVKWHLSKQKVTLRKGG